MLYNYAKAVFSSKSFLSRYASSTTTSIKETLPYKSARAVSLTHTVEQALGLKCDETCSIAGRVMRLRTHGAITYCDIQQNNKRIQVVLKQNEFNDSNVYLNIKRQLHRGAICVFEGRINHTSTKQLSLFATQADIITPCKAPPPTDYVMEAGQVGIGELRRRRYLDLLHDPKVRNMIQTRETIQNVLRKYLTSRSYIEVQTPVLSNMSGGAGGARPFTTEHFDGHVPLMMRVAPELYLKMLVAGGLERVFEIGAQFRNEGIDRIHSPEFTMCEWYCAYADYLDTMTQLEHILRDIVVTVKGSLSCEVTAMKAQERKHIIDFTPSFKRIDFYEELRKRCKPFELPNPDELHTRESRHQLRKICQAESIELPYHSQVPHILDKLSSVLLEKNCIQPTIIMNQPQIMSPLAQPHSSRPGISERFELFINGLEFSNAYSELTDPVIQRRTIGEEEAEMHGEFLNALELGLPPTAGCGLSIDRLTMLLCDERNIKETILFPLNKNYDYRKIKLEKELTMSHDIGDIVT